MDVSGQEFPPTSERGDGAESLQAGLPRRGTAADHSPHSSPLPCHASLGSGSRHPNDPSLAGPSSHRDHGSVHARHLGGRRLLCTQVLRSSRVPTLLRKAFPQKLPIFPAFCLAKTFFSRFFSHSANIAGICCVVIIMGFPPRLSNLGAASHDDRPRCQATLRLGLP